MVLLLLVLLVFLLLVFVLVFEHAAGHGAADRPDDAVVHLVSGETARGAAGESAHEAAVFGAGLGRSAVGAWGRVAVL